MLQTWCHFEFTEASYDRIKLVEQTPFGIISNDAKIKDFPTRQRLLIFSCSAV